ncbi:uncharacterized protein LOC133626453 isoform X2 [Colius striatus]|uniref:uncharacterized protein LOC133626453 isoform X2 n=1 Tax=Colius striatus TaxID=57412 RepID=UPI002B1CF0A8|nr:uncharacterized protein LOC133626453 isoform X2 [Colius striatus]
MATFRAASPQHHLWLLHPHAPVSLLALPARVRNTLEICSCHTAQDSLEFGTCRNRRCAMNSLQQEHVKAQAASRGAQLTVSQRVRAGAHPGIHKASFSPLGLHHFSRAPVRFRRTGQGPFSPSKVVTSFNNAALPTCVMTYSNATVTPTQINKKQNGGKTRSG